MPPRRELPPWTEHLLWIVPALLAVATYIGTLWAPFVYDDHHQIVYNTFLQTVGEPFSLYLKPLWYGMGIEDSRYYRPTMAAQFWMVWNWLGHSPYWFHLANVLLHATVTALVVVVGRRLLHNKGAVFVAGLLFALHPIHIEPVSWIGCSGDILAAMFALLAYWLVLRPSLPRILGACVCLFLALTAKEIGLTVVAVRVVDLWLKKKRRESVLTAVTGAAVLGFYIGLRLYASSGYQQLDAFAPFTRWYFFEIFGRYLGFLILPLRFDLHRSPDFVAHPGPAEIAPFALLFLAYLGFVVTSYIKGWWRVTLCLVWIAVTLIPACNLIPIPMLMGERSAYLASVASCWLFGLALVQRRFVAPVALFIILPVYAYLVGQRLPDWSDEVLTWQSSLQYHPRNYEILGGLAGSLLREGNYRRAEQVYAMLRGAGHDLENQMGLARSLHGQKRYHESSAVLNAVPSVEPPVLLLEGKNQFYLGRPQLALRLWAPLQETPELALWRGLAQGRLGNTEKAREALQRAAASPATRGRAEMQLQRLKGAPTP